MLVLRVASLRGDVGALLGVVEVGEAGVVELEVAAAALGHQPHLVGVRRGQVVPELVLVGIDVRVDRGRPAAVVDHARRRDGQLRRHPLRRHRLEVVEGTGEDRLLDAHRRVDHEAGRGEVEVARGVVEVDLDLLVGPADALDLVDEVHVPRRTAELAVGDRLEPGILLQAYDVRDRGVLGRGQLLVGDLPVGMGCPGLEQRLVVGAGCRRGRLGTVGCCAGSRGSPSLGYDACQSNTAAAVQPTRTRVQELPRRARRSCGSCARTAP